MAKRKPSPALKKITNRAKAIRAKAPRTKWIAAVKQASREYNSGKLGGTVKVKRTTTRKKTYSRKRSTPSRRRKIGNVISTQRRNPEPFGGARIQMVNGIGGMSVGNAKQIIKSEAKQKLASALLRRDMATTKRDKRKIGKQVVKYRSELKKYC